MRRAALLSSALLVSLPSVVFAQNLTFGSLAGTSPALDFGIAKVLDPAEIDNPQPSTRLLTPEYASPEQIRGDRSRRQPTFIRWARFCAFCSQESRPHGIAGLSPLQAAQAVAEREVPAMDRLPRDLNAILLKALRNDPARRYGSVEEFGLDLARYLEAARRWPPDSFAYRSRKFQRRRRGAAAATAAVATALVGGADLALWQAHRAERRFADARHLASSSCIRSG